MSEPVTSAHDDAFARHGGALDAARALFPAAPQPWVDLSTGINPVPYPIGELAAADWARLPGAAGLAALERAAAKRYHAPLDLAVVAAPGTSAIIGRLPALAEGRDVRLLGPTYGEFATAYRDARVRVVEHVEALAGADVAVAVNPNNPDGRRSTPEALARLALRVGALVVDEAFADALPPAGSLIPHLEHAAVAARTTVLRSFGKTYGLAGLRLGFAVTAAERGAALRRMLGPWPVSGPAITLGTRALADEDWLNRAVARLRSDGARLGFLLGQIGAAPVGHTPLFRLVSHPVAPELFLSLARSGILARPFANRRDWLRFGLPGQETEWARLETALQPFR